MKIYTVILFLVFSLPLSAVTYQGELSQSGNTYTGSADLEFRLFDSAQGGNLIGAVDLHSDVNVLNGRFVVELEQWTGLFDGADYWLEIAAAIPANSGSFTTLAPRQKISPVPYAEYAYDLDLTGIQQRVSGSCAGNSAIQVINVNGDVTCGDFAAETHNHAFTNLTAVPTGLGDGDDDTTYDGTDFALSNQSCAVGQMVSAIAADGSITCNNVPTTTAPPNCDQSNQALQYNSTTGWLCVNISQIGPSNGAAQGYEIKDSWGNTWDGTERLAQSWSEANQLCESLGGRLPTITELYRVSGAFKSDLGSSYETNYLWSRTWWNKTNKARVRLTDGLVSNALTSNMNPFRCIWPEPEVGFFADDNCMGEPGDACWDHVAYSNNTVSMDKMERPAVSYVAATDECAFVNAHLAEQQDYAENAINGLPNGSNDWQWTSSHAQFNLAYIVRWLGVAVNYSDGGAPNVATSVRSANVHKFRCVGVNYAAGSHPTTFANEFITDSTFLKSIDSITNTATFGDSIDSCSSLGGHMAHSRDIMELARSGFTSGTGADYVWTTDFTSGDAFTQVVRWTGTDTAYTGYHSEYVTWAEVNLTNQYQHRCVFYPIDSSFTYPPEAACYPSGNECHTIENGATKFAIDYIQRSDATYLQASQDCIDSGGRLPTVIQLIEAIRAGVVFQDLSPVWTMDSAGGSSSNAIIVNYEFNDVDFSEFTPLDEDVFALDKDLIADYLCVWSNEMK